MFDFFSASTSSDYKLVIFLVIAIVDPNYLSDDGSGKKPDGAVGLDEVSVDLVNLLWVAIQRSNSRNQNWIDWNDVWNVNAA